MKYDMLHAVLKVGTRKKQWLIVNDTGGLVQEFSGTQRQAEARAKLLNDRREADRKRALEQSSGR